MAVISSASSSELRNFDDIGGVGTGIARAADFDVRAEGFSGLRRSEPILLAGADLGPALDCVPSGAALAAVSRGFVVDFD